MTVEQVWAKVEAERLRYGLAMAREDAGTVEKRVDLDRSAVRAGFLAVHVDACGKATDTGFTGVDPKWCGDDWFCPAAELIRALGKEGEG